MSKLVWLTALGALAWATVSVGQAPPVRIRGNVQSLDGDVLVVATPTEGVVRVTLGASTGINGLEPRTPADLQIGLTPRTVIVGLTAGDRSLLVPGAAVFALAAPAEGGGPAAAVAVIAETRGVKPPM